MQDSNDNQQDQIVELPAEVLDLVGGGGGGSDGTGIRMQDVSTGAGNAGLSF